jgi:cytoskeletal protein RodZ
VTAGDELDPTQAVPLPEPEPDATRVWQADPPGPPPRPPAGPPPGRPEPPDRRPWILVGLLGAIVVVLIAILLLRGDDDDTVAGEGSTTTSSVADSSTSSTSAPSSTTSTTAATTTTSTASTVDPAECTAAGASQTKVGAAAQALFDAWVRGDEACARELTTDAARAELFSRDGTGAQDQLQGCEEKLLPTVHADCTFSYEGGATHYLGRFDGGWRFYDIEQVAD